MEKIYDIRWAFFYDDTTSAFGLWSFDPGEPMFDISKQRRWGLDRAEIHARNNLTGVIERVLSVPGNLYKNFEWLAVAAAPSNAGVTVMKLPSTIIGMRMLLTDGRVCTFFINGHKEEDKI